MFIAGNVKLFQGVYLKLIFPILNARLHNQAFKFYDNIKILLELQPIEVSFYSTIPEPTTLLLLGFSAVMLRKKR